MDMTERLKALALMTQRFGHDNPISLATANDNTPSVRTVNGYYENGVFYTLTYALSNKMKQIEVNPTVAICGEWFTAHGVGESLGWIGDENNAALAEKLRSAFSSWYSNGHTNESGPNTIILRIRLTDGVLANQGTLYHIDFNDMGAQ